MLRFFAAVMPPTSVPVIDPGIIVSNAVRIFMLVIGALAVGMVVFAAITMITSGGNVEKTKTARKMLVWGIVGLLIALLSIVIVNLVGGLV